jgi:hypothetical protein
MSYEWPRNLADATISVEDVGEEFSLLDEGFLVTDVSIGKVDVRTNKVQVPGRDGDLDLTEALGGVTYGNRDIVLALATAYDTTSAFLTAASSMRNKLDGRQVKVTLSSDAAYYWQGRASFEYEYGKGVSEATLTVDAEPFKRSVYSSYDPWEWDPFNFVTGVVTQANDISVSNSTATLEMPRDPARTRPTLWLNSGTAKVRLKGQTSWQTLKAGANIVPEIRLSDTEDTALEVSGTGHVGVEYRVGSL